MAHLPQPDTKPPDPALALGRAVVKDLSNARVIERLLMYERRIEHSLFKTILELQRLTLTREFNPAVNPLLNVFRHSQSPRHEESPAPKPDMSPSVCSRPFDYLAPGSTGGHKTETPNPPQTQAVGCAVHTISSVQNKPNFQARRPAERRPRTYFQNPVSVLPVTSANPAAFNPEQPLALRNMCGAKGVILQNKPNLQKCKTTLNHSKKRTCENTTLPSNPKNKPNSNPIKPNFNTCGRRAGRFEDCRSGWIGYNGILPAGWGTNIRLD